MQHQNAIKVRREWSHPELRKGEIFIINLNIEKGEEWPQDSFSETRIGDVAYITGTEKIVPNLKPLFGKLKAK